MAVFLITCELHNGRNYEQINECIDKLGDCIRPLSTFWLVNTDKSFNELYNHINSALGRDDMFYITAISSAGIGRLDMDDTSWIKNKFFIPSKTPAPTGNTRGPLPVKEPASAHRPASTASRQRYPQLHWD